MSVHYIHAPYMQISRDKLVELQQAGADIVYAERWAASDDSRYDFSKEGDVPYISFLPSILLIDDDEKTVLCRAEHVQHITKANIDWMHSEHAKWKNNGKKFPFPKPPWA